MRNIKIFFVSLMLRVASLFIKRDENVVAFGSWAGSLYSDNSKYFFEYLLEHYKEKTLIWVGNKELKEKVPTGPNVHFVEKDSFASFKWLLKAKYLFCTQMHRADLSTYNVYQGSEVVYFDHGIAGIKKWAQDALDYDGAWESRGAVKRIFDWTTGESYPYSYFTVSAKKGGETYISALAYRGCSEDKLLRTGIPRNDNLIKMSSDTAYIAQKKQEYAEILGFDSNKKVVLYLPTFRRKEKTVVSFLDMDPTNTKRLDEVLEAHHAVLLEKNHFVDIARGQAKIENGKNVVKVEVPVDLQEMFLFTDVVISDYSSCYLDFILLDRPVIHFTYDADRYANIDSGLYFPIEEFAAGKVTETFEQTIDEIAALLSGKDCYAQRRAQVKKDFLEYETGNACEKIYKVLWERK